MLGPYFYNQISRNDGHADVLGRLALIWANLQNLPDMVVIHASTDR